jgi:hypothetical protein
MNPEWFLPGITQGEGEGDQDSVLSGQLYSGYVVERSCTLRLGALQKGIDPNHDENSNGSENKNFDWRKVAFGSAELVTDVDGRPASDGWGIGTCGSG